VTRDAPELRPLAWGRIALGALFLLRTTPLLLPTHLPFTVGTFPLLGWPATGWQGAPLGIALPPVALAIACIVRTVAAIGFLLGVWTRGCGIVACAIGYLVMAQTPFGFNATLHLLFQGTLVLAIGDAGVLYALRGEPIRNPRSSQLLVRALLASVYFWAGFCKLRPDWLDGRTLALFHTEKAISGAFADLVLAAPWSQALVARVIVTTELSLPVLLFWRRTRAWAPLLALAMHASIELAAHPDLLGWEMAALLLCLWPPVPASPT
jgi:hypothetical protein